MLRPQLNFAFIDSQNLYLSIHELGWDLDYGRFRIYLAEKYGVSQAFLSFSNDFHQHFWLLSVILKRP